jgi:hypothetical protein
MVGGMASQKRNMDPKLFKVEASVGSKTNHGVPPVALGAGAKL